MDAQIKITSVGLPMHINIKNVKIRVLLLALFVSTKILAQQTLDLSGAWNVKVGSQPEKSVIVPGLAGDPKKMESVVYSKQITLPNLPSLNGEVKLVLNGARFDPEIFINKKKVGSAEGGIAPLSFWLFHPDLKPGKTIELEIKK
jgi:hypothetical protein